MNGSYTERLEKAAEAIQAAELVLIGGGAGLSAAAGLAYGGERFSANFPDFIARYKMTDMYSAGFYPFPTREEKWAYWARHIQLNRYTPDAGRVYLDLFGLVKDRNYFVVTTNVDAQFYKAGFDPQKVFAVQGDYGKLQCGRCCHDSLYDIGTKPLSSRKIWKKSSACCRPALKRPAEIFPVAPARIVFRRSRFAHQLTTSTPYSAKCLSAVTTGSP